VVGGLTIAVAARGQIEVAVRITDCDKALLDTSVEIAR
jgi:hypothetical protein